MTALPATKLFPRILFVLHCHISMSLPVFDFADFRDSLSNHPTSRIIIHQSEAFSLIGECPDELAGRFYRFGLFIYFSLVLNP